MKGENDGGNGGLFTIDLPVSAYDSPTSLREMETDDFIDFLLLLLLLIRFVSSSSSSVCAFLMLFSPLLLSISFQKHFPTFSFPPSILFLFPFPSPFQPSLCPGLLCQSISYWRGRPLSLSPHVRLLWVTGTWAILRVDNSVQFLFPSFLPEPNGPQKEATKHCGPPIFRLFPPSPLASRLRATLGQYNQTSTSWFSD